MTTGRINQVTALSGVRGGGGGSKDYLSLPSPPPHFPLSCGVAERPGVGSPSGGGARAAGRWAEAWGGAGSSGRDRGGKWLSPSSPLSPPSSPDLLPLLSPSIPPPSFPPSRFSLLPSSPDLWRGSLSRFSPLERVGERPRRLPALAGLPSPSPLPSPPPSLLAPSLPAPAGCVASLPRLRGVPRGLPAPCGAGPPRGPSPRGGPRPPFASSWVSLLFLSPGRPVAPERRVSPRPGSALPPSYLRLRSLASPPRKGRGALEPAHRYGPSRASPPGATAGRSRPPSGFFLSSRPPSPPRKRGKGDDPLGPPGPGALLPKVFG